MANPERQSENPLAPRPILDIEVLDISDSIDLVKNVFHKPNGEINELFIDQPIIIGKTTSSLIRLPRIGISSGTKKCYFSCELNLSFFSTDKDRIENLKLQMQTLAGGDVVIEEYEAYFSIYTPKVYLGGFSGGFRKDKGYFWYYLPNLEINLPQGLKLLQIYTAETYNTTLSDPRLADPSKRTTLYIASPRLFDQKLSDPARAAFEEFRSSYKSKNIVKINPELKETDERTQKRTADEQALYDSLRHKVLLKEETATTFSQIGGQASAVKEAVVLASQLKHPDQFKKWGILQPPKAIIFYGKPGNGKTLLAKAIATEVDAVFLHANAEDLLSNWQGLSAKLTKILFEICRDEAKKQGKHAILYIDEIEALIPSRKGRISEAALLSTSVILRELDGLLELGPITLITSANNLDALDSAFLSRMTKQIEIPDPDAEGIEGIFKIHLDKANKIAGRILTTPTFEIHGENFVGLSGRDIENIIKVVLTTKAQQELEGKETPLITEKDIIEVMVVSGKLIPRETKNN